MVNIIYCTEELDIYKYKILIKFQVFYEFNIFFYINIFILSIQNINTFQFNPYNLICTEDIIFILLHHLTYLFIFMP